MPYVLLFSTIHGGRMTVSVETENVDSDIGKAFEDLAPKIRETPVESKANGQDVPQAVSISRVNYNLLCPPVPILNRLLAIGYRVVSSHERDDTTTWTLLKSEEDMRRRMTPATQAFSLSDTLSF